MPHDQALWSNKDVNIYEIVELNILNWKGGAKFVFTFVFPHQDWNIICVCVCTQSCPTLFDPMDCSPPDSSSPWDLPGKNAGVGCHFLLQGIFPTQGSNLHLLHW